MERQKRRQNKENRELVQNILDEAQSVELQPTCLTQINDLPGTSAESDFEKLKRSYDALIIENNEANKKMEKYQEEIAQINLRNVKLQQENDDIQKKRK